MPDIILDNACIQCSVTDYGCLGPDREAGRTVGFRYDRNAQANFRPEYDFFTQYYQSGGVHYSFSLITDQTDVDWNPRNVSSNWPPSGSAGTQHFVTTKPSTLTVIDESKGNSKIEWEGYNSHTSSSINHTYTIHNAVNGVMVKTIVRNDGTEPLTNVKFLLTVDVDPNMTWDYYYSQPYFQFQADMLFGNEEFHPMLTRENSIISSGHYWGYWLALYSTDPIPHSFYAIRPWVDNKITDAFKTEVLERDDHLMGVVFDLGEELAPGESREFSYTFIAGHRDDGYVTIPEIELAEKPPITPDLALPSCFEFGANDSFVLKSIPDKNKYRVSVNGDFISEVTYDRTSVSAFSVLNDYFFIRGMTTIDGRVVFKNNSQEPLTVLLEDVTNRRSSALVFDTELNDNPAYQIVSTQADDILKIRFALAPFEETSYPLCGFSGGVPPLVIEDIFTPPDTQCETELQSLLKDASLSLLEEGREIPSQFWLRLANRDKLQNKIVQLFTNGSSVFAQDAHNVVQVRPNSAKVCLAPDGCEDNSVNISCEGSLPSTGCIDLSGKFFVEVDGVVANNNKSLTVDGALQFLETEGIYTESCRAISCDNSHMGLLISPFLPYQQNSQIRIIINGDVIGEVSNTPYYQSRIVSMFKEVQDRYFFKTVMYEFSTRPDGLSGLMILNRSLTDRLNIVIEKITSETYYPNNPTFPAYNYKVYGIDDSETLQEFNMDTTKRLLQTNAVIDDGTYLSMCLAPLDKYVFSIEDILNPDGTLTNPNLVPDNLFNKNGSFIALYSDGRAKFYVNGVPVITSSVEYAFMSIRNFNLLAAMTTSERLLLSVDGPTPLLKTVVPGALSETQIEVYGISEYPRDLTDVLPGAAIFDDISTTPATSGFYVGNLVQEATPDFLYVAPLPLFSHTLGTYAILMLADGFESLAFGTGNIYIEEGLLMQDGWVDETGAEVDRSTVYTLPYPGHPEAADFTLGDIMEKRLLIDVYDYHSRIMKIVYATFAKKINEVVGNPNYMVYDLEHGLIIKDYSHHYFYYFDFDPDDEIGGHPRDSIRQKEYFLMGYLPFSGGFYN